MPNVTWTESGWEGQKYLVELRIKSPLAYKKFMENLEVVTMDSAKIARKVMEELASIR